MGVRAAVRMEAGAPEGIQVSPDGGLDHMTWKVPGQCPLSEVGLFRCWDARDQSTTPATHPIAGKGQETLALRFLRRR